MTKPRMQHPEATDLTFQIDFNLLHMKCKKTLPPVKMPPFPPPPVLYTFPTCSEWHWPCLHCLHCWETNFNLHQRIPSTPQTVLTHFQALPFSWRIREITAAELSEHSTVGHKQHQNPHGSLPQLSTRDSYIAQLFSQFFNTFWNTLEKPRMSQTDRAWKRHSLTNLLWARSIIYNLPPHNEILNNQVTGQL